MCGRFVSVTDPEQLAEHFEADEVRTEPLGERYNVAPTLEVYAVLERDGSRRLGSLRWGFVPYWAKQLKGAPSPINARVEGIADNGMFAEAFAKRRCLLPADGFYEWQDRDDRPKQPYYLADPDGEPLAFAGIWSVWRDRDADTKIYSAAIVTTEARGKVADIHPRMPVILPRRLWKTWLTAPPEDAPHLPEAIAALGPPRLRATPITARVNNVRNAGPDLLEPGEVA
jgi:putative SOS response-associated peptidase YedK